MSFTIFFIGMNSVPVRAQSYDFDVDYMRADVTIKKDGSIDIEYWINFTCNSWQEIDVVDIGFPNKHYDMDSIEAFLIKDNHIYEL